MLARPPTPTPHLVSRAFIRASLRRVTGAREVADDAVHAAVEALEARFQALLAEAHARYREELELRAIHGVYPRASVREDHVRSRENTAAPPGRERNFRGGTPNHEAPVA